MRRRWCLWLRTFPRTHTARLMQDVGQGRTQYVGHAGELFGKHVGSGLVLGSAGCKGLQTHVEAVKEQRQKIQLLRRNRAVTAPALAVSVLLICHDRGCLKRKLNCFSCFSKQ